ncbi:hypothetical protein [Ruminococcus albus]|uniref:DUF4367 domain-containing protein n=1 Tax=Ruminococcus albus TaxID=1264 RepID=A0A1I1EWN6_RUMAL|nr:hypothetical protein [Ruminococcus albus]SFB89350.1 hypothetical protein SAMN02910406_00781 [Ruminococcus albus]
MKDNDFRRIENQLEPDDRLVRYVIDKASQLSANSEMAEDYLKSHDVSDTITVKHNRVYRYVLSAAAALALVFGAGIYIRSNNAVKTHTLDVSSSVDSVVEVTDSTAEAAVAENVSVSESIAEALESKVDIPDSTLDTPARVADEDEAEIRDDGRSEWKPDRTADSFETKNGNGQAAVLAPATDEYRSFEMNDTTYYFACGNKGEIYDPEQMIGNNIPNISYINEFLKNVEVPSMFGDIRPSAQAEVYSLQFADPNYIVAVRFIDVNGDERYYLFADMDHSFDTLEEHLLALNIDIYTFDGTAIIRRDGVRSFVDDDSTLKEMLLSSNGEKTDTAYGEALCEIFLDTPIYGGSVGYTVYSDGYIGVVNGFGSESIYNVGTETTAQMVSYINENCHE